MNPEKQIFKNTPDNEIINPIEIPAQEIESLNSIHDFLDQLSAKEYEDFDGSIRPDEDIREKRQALFRIKKERIDQNLSFSDKKRSALGFQARRETEYEASKNIIEYKKEQLCNLVNFIESQKIWKMKFNTASNVTFSRTKHKTWQMFVDELEKSEYEHKRLSFAGQNMNSIYFLSRNGMSLRVKVDCLFNDNGNIREALPIPQELFICINATADDIFPKIHPEGTKFLLRRPSDVSFKPKIGFQVEEFCTKEFLGHKEGDFKSKIQVTKDKEGIVIKNANGFHSGHCINKILSLKN